MIIITAPKRRRVTQRSTKKFLRFLLCKLYMVNEREDVEVGVKEGTLDRTIRM